MWKTIKKKRADHSIVCKRHLDVLHIFARHIFLNYLSYTPVNKRRRLAIERNARFEAQTSSASTARRQFAEAPSRIRP